MKKFLTTVYNPIFERLPKEFDGFTIAQISDLHNANFKGKLTFQSWFWLGLINRRRCRNYLFESEKKDLERWGIPDRPHDYYLKTFKEMGEKLGLVCSYSSWNGCY